MLGNSLAFMVRKLREVVGNVKEASANVAAGSGELSSSSVQMSQGATEQAASAEEASSSMEEMAANIRQNAENAMQTEKIALKSSENAKEGGKAVSETVIAMKQIAEKIGDHRRNRPSDGFAGLERRYRGCPRRGTRQGFCRGGVRGTQAFRTQPEPPQPKSAVFLATVWTLLKKPEACWKGFFPISRKRRN